MRPGARRSIQGENPFFISEDPLWGNIRDPLSLNRFAYGRNNPYRYVDPSGQDLEESLIEGERIMNEREENDGDTDGPRLFRGQRLFRGSGVQVLVKVLGSESGKGSGKVLGSES